VWPSYPNRDGGEARYCERPFGGDFLDRFALEADSRELFHVQKIRAFDIFVPLRKSGVVQGYLT
jgi:hypothetical protein